MHMKKNTGIISLRQNYFWKYMLHLKCEEKPSVKSTEDILRSYVNDYCQDMMEQRIAEVVQTQVT